MVTLKDVAKAAGVSAMTVSRVIHGNTSGVSQETRAKIQEIIDTMGYVPNASARSLVGSSSHIITVLVSKRHYENPLESPYNAELLGVIANAVQQEGYCLMVRLVDTFQDITPSLRSWHSEGAIFLGVFDSEMLQIQNDNKIPLVFTDSYSSMRQIINVGIDDFKGGSLAAAHLAGLGHRQFAFIGPSIQENGVIRHRYEGFCLGLNDLGIPSEAITAYTSDTEEHMALALEDIRRRHGELTAIFSASDVIAANLIQDLHHAGFQIPADYSIMGFDNQPIGRFLTPQLTTISQDVHRKAELAVEILFRHIKDAGAPAENIVLDVQLVERASTASRV